MKELDLSIFPKSSPHDWLQVAQEQLEGENPYERLAWESLGVKHLKPYYDEADLENLTYLSDFFGSIVPHRWKLYEKIAVESEREANEIALKALMGGCDGIIFYFEKEINEDQLLKEINVSICDISAFPSLLLTEGCTGMNIHNCVFESSKNHDPIGQLTNLLSNVTSQHRWIHRKAFSDFFLEIASVRALRFLLETHKQCSPFIHTTVPKHASKDHQWFLNTTGGMAAILGGSHSIDMPTAMGDRRITANVAHLIREESYIKYYNDPCGGSYFIESLTDQIIGGVKRNLDLDEE